ncbi:MAG: GWxTD domain-containing protein [bacterium]|nr:MAG: GWxTD domain-containing protein [bacterium]
MFLFRIKLTLLLLLLPATLSAQSDLSMDQPPQGAGFDVSVSQMFDEDGTVLLVVSTAVPYRRLVFLKKGERYEARYRVLVDVRDTKDRHVRGDAWEETVAALDYGETKKTSSLSKSKRSFPVESGDYTVLVTLEVLDTSLEYTRRKKIRVLGYEEEGIGLSEPFFLISGDAPQAEKPQAGVIVLSACPPRDSQAFSENPGAVYADFRSWPRLVVNLIGPPGHAQPERLTVSTQITDPRKDMLLYNRSYVKPTKAGYVRLCLEFNIDEFPIGDYRVNMAVESPEERKKTTTVGRFTILLNRSSLGRHFNDTLVLLSIIADDDDLAELRSAQPDERYIAWRRFWKKQDSTPRTVANEDLEEFLRRVNYVLRHFSKRRPGWETDVGRIYIKYGRPDKIEEREGRNLGTNYLFWFYYSRGVLFIFEDTLGTGDFHLVATRQI